MNNQHLTAADRGAIEILLRDNFNKREDPAESIHDLCGALDDGFSRLGPLCIEVEEGAAALDAELGRITPSLDRMVRRLSRWVDRHGGMGASVNVAQAAALAEHGTPEVRGLAALAAECRGLHLPFDEAVIRQRLGLNRLEYEYNLYTDKKVY